MTQDEIIEMATYIANTLGSRMCDENGDTYGEELYCMSFDDIVDSIKMVSEESVIKEREACAKLVEEMPCDCCWPESSISVAEDFAESIRARGEQQ